jgi:hypothetical protein
MSARTAGTMDLPRRAVKGAAETYAVAENSLSQEEIRHDTVFVAPEECCSWLDRLGRRATAV